MNVLVVSENFGFGGLETSIVSQYDYLKDKVNFFFAFGNYSKKIKLPSDKVTYNFNFKYDSTLNEFLFDIERLVEIINKKNIDVVHIHPFYSFFPAVIASHITKKPFLYTLHGYGSYSFPPGINYNIMFEFFIRNLAQNILCVSEELQVKLSKDIGLANLNYLPNSISKEFFVKNKYPENKKWAIVSRLDSDKVQEIKRIILNFEKIDIEHIDIYGDGSCFEEIKTMILDLGFQKNIILKGFVENTPEPFIGKYNGIIGIGRVNMESIAMGIPTIIIGRGKISGVINREKFNKIKKLNFVNLVLNDMDFDELNEELNNIDREEVEELNNLMFDNFSAQVVNEKYLKHLKETNHIDYLGISSFFEELKHNASNSNLENERICDSSLISSMLFKHFNFTNLSSNLRLFFALNDEISKKFYNSKVSINNIFDNVQLIDKKIIMLEEKEINIENKVKFLEEKINERKSILLRLKIVIKRILNGKN